MGIERLSMRVLAGLTLFAGFGLVAKAQPPAVTVEDALRRLPKQPGVEVSTPAQVGQCRVEPIPNKNDPKTPLGYVVRDPAGNPVRQFVSYDGKTFNIVAFYVNGVEAYREVFPPRRMSRTSIAGSGRTAPSGDSTGTATAGSTSGSSSRPKN